MHHFGTHASLHLALVQKGWNIIAPLILIQQFSILTDWYDFLIKYIVSKFFFWSDFTRYILYLDSIWIAWSTWEYGNNFAELSPKCLYLYTLTFFGFYGFFYDFFPVRFRCKIESDYYYQTGHLWCSNVVTKKWMQLL